MEQFRQSLEMRKAALSLGRICRHVAPSVSASSTEPPPKSSSEFSALSSSSGLIPADSSVKVNLETTHSSSAGTSTQGFPHDTACTSSSSDAVGKDTKAGQVRNAAPAAGTGMGSEADNSHESSFIRNKHRLLGPRSSHQRGSDGSLVTPSSYLHGGTPGFMATTSPGSTSTSFRSVLSSGRKGGSIRTIFGPGGQVIGSTTSRRYSSIGSTSGFHSAPATPLFSPLVGTWADETDRYFPLETPSSSSNSASNQGTATLLVANVLQRFLGDTQSTRSTESKNKTKGSLETVSPSIGAALVSNTCAGTSPIVITTPSVHSRRRSRSLTTTTHHPYSFPNTPVQQFSSPYGSAGSKRSNETDKLAASMSPSSSERSDPTNSVGTSGNPMVLENVSRAASIQENVILEPAKYHASFQSLLNKQSLYSDGAPSVAAVIPAQAQLAALNYTTSNAPNINASSDIRFELSERNRPLYSDDPGSSGAIVSGVPSWGKDFTVGANARSERNAVSSTGSTDSAIVSSIPSSALMQQPLQPPPPSPPLISKQTTPTDASLLNQRIVYEMLQLQQCYQEYQTVLQSLPPDQQLLLHTLLKQQQQQQPEQQQQQPEQQQQQQPQQQKPPPFPSQLLPPSAMIVGGADAQHPPSPPLQAVQASLRNLGILSPSLPHSSVSPSMVPSGFLAERINFGTASLLPSMDARPPVYNAAAQSATSDFTSCNVGGRFLPGTMGSNEIHAQLPKRDISESRNIPTESLPSMHPATIFGLNSGNLLSNSSSPAVGVGPHTGFQTQPIVGAVYGSGTSDQQSSSTSPQQRYPCDWNNILRQSSDPSLHLPPSNNGSAYPGKPKAPNQAMKPKAPPYQPRMNFHFSSAGQSPAYAGNAVPPIRAESVSATTLSSVPLNPAFLQPEVAFSAQMVRGIPQHSAINLMKPYGEKTDIMGESGISPAQQPRQISGTSSVNRLHSPSMPMYGLVGGGANAPEVIGLKIPSPPRQTSPGIPKDSQDQGKTIGFSLSVDAVKRNSPQGSSPGGNFSSTPITTMAVMSPIHGTPPPLSPSSSLFPNPPPVSPKVMQEYETQLKNFSVKHLNTREINPYLGSVPVERLQNIIRVNYTELYNTVVGNKHNSWRRFLKRHTDAFETFSVEDGKWRVRLLVHENWKEGDRLEQKMRASKELHLVECLITFLQSTPSQSCRVDEFMEAYPRLPQNQLSAMEFSEQIGILGTSEGTGSPYPLPARGDLVRFVRRHPLYFVYDHEKLSICLANPAGAGTGGVAGASVSPLNSAAAAAATGMP